MVPELVVHRAGERYVYVLESPNAGDVMGRCVRCGYPIKAGEYFGSNVGIGVSTADVVIFHEDCWEPTNSRAAGLTCECE